MTFYYVSKYNKDESFQISKYWMPESQTYL